MEEKSLENVSASPQNFSTEDGENMALDAETKAILILLGLTALLITLANSLVFVLAWFMKYLRTKTNLFLLSLAASDFLSGALVIPLLISCNAADYSESVCWAMDICQRFLALSTILHLACAVLERYLKISYPFKYTSLVTRPRIAVVLTSVWIVALLVSLAQLFITQDDFEQSRNAYLIYNVTVLSIFVFFPFVSTLVAYVHIFIIMKKSKMARSKMAPNQSISKRGTKKRVNEKRSLVVYFSMIICFVVAWFPYFFLTLLIDLDYSLVRDIPHWVDIMFLFLKYSSALFDPLLFTFFKADFQRALRQMASGKMWKEVTNISTRSRSGRSARQPADSMPWSARSVPSTYI